VAVDGTRATTMGADMAETAVAMGLELVETAVSIGPLIPGFTLIRHLGSGAMGDVYEARDASGAAVALKVLTSAASAAPGAARVAREIAALSAVQHPNVVRLHAHGSHGGRTWLAMELVAGRDLEAVLDERGPLAEVDALRVALQVARGLGHVHAVAGIIHRDIKPANLLLVHGAGGDAVKVIDFGLAKAPGRDAAMTRTGIMVGTPLYMAPEQIRGDERIGPAADIYALGATLVHLLTGHAPYAGANAYEIMRRHLDDPLPDLAACCPGLRPATRRLITTALAKEPGQRHDGWAAFIAGAEAALAACAGAPQPLRLLRVPLAPGQTLRLRRERQSPDAFQHAMPGRLRRQDPPRCVERLEICPRSRPAAARARSPSPAALALLRAYRAKTLALPTRATTTPTPVPLPLAIADQHLVPLALLLAAAAAWSCTWL